MTNVTLRLPRLVCPVVLGRDMRVAKAFSSFNFLKSHEMEKCKISCRERGKTPGSRNHHVTEWISRRRNRARLLKYQNYCCCYERVALEDWTKSSDLFPFHRTLWTLLKLWRRSQRSSPGPGLGRWVGFFFPSFFFLTNSLFIYLLYFKKFRLQLTFDISFEYAA